jgi:hypothetical protein
MDDENRSVGTGDDATTVGMARRQGNHNPTGAETKVCPTCKRAFSNRKRWRSRGMWDQVIYCGESCRNKKTKQV